MTHPISKVLSSFGAASASKPPISASSPGPSEFGSLLAHIRGEAGPSGLPVTLASGVKADLSADQLERLAIAADRAHMEGASRAIVLIDGQTLKLDVATRQVLGAVQLQPGRVLTGIDAIVQAPVRAGGSATVLGGPGSGLGNASLMKILAERGATPVA